MIKRVFYNPKVKDKVTVLKTKEETNGDHILIEVELAAKGGTPLHYHTSFDETFIPVKGILGVEVAGKRILIPPGETAIAKKKQLHRFYNPGNSVICFRVKISPAENRFIESLCIGYGLAEDGLTNNKGIPKRLDHLAVLMEHSDTRFTGFLSLIEFFILRRAKKARAKGVMQMLIEKYCVN